MNMSISTVVSARGWNSPSASTLARRRAAWLAISSTPSCVRPRVSSRVHSASLQRGHQALPASQALPSQPDQGKIVGFDFSRDPLNATRPMQPFEEIRHADVQAKPQVMAAQRQLLERRYDLTPRPDPEATMARGKPLPVGPTARLAAGTEWTTLAGMTPDAIRQRNLFPYPALPHPKQVAGGQVFPAMQIAMFPRLERFDVDFDLPDAFLPEFPPAIFLQHRPELGDVSRGEVVSIARPWEPVSSREPWSSYGMCALQKQPMGRLCCCVAGQKAIKPHCIWSRTSLRQMRRVAGMANGFGLKRFSQTRKVAASICINRIYPSRPDSRAC